MKRSKKETSLMPALGLVIEEHARGVRRRKGGGTSGKFEYECQAYSTRGGKAEEGESEEGMNCGG